MLFNNHSGVFVYTSPLAEAEFLCYLEYDGMNAVGWLEYRMYCWLGELANESWDGHQPWDFDIVLMCDRFGFHEICSVWGAGYASPARDTMVGYTEYPEPSERQLQHYQECLQVRNAAENQSYGDILDYAFYEDDGLLLMDYWFALMDGAGRIRLLTSDPVTTAKPDDWLHAEATLPDWLGKVEKDGFLSRKSLSGSLAG